MPQIRGRSRWDIQGLLSRKRTTGDVPRCRGHGRGRPVLGCRQWDALRCGCAFSGVIRAGIEPVCGIGNRYLRIIRCSSIIRRIIVIIRIVKVGVGLFLNDFRFALQVAHLAVKGGTQLRRCAAKPVIALPRVRPSSGSFFGPNRSRARTTMKTVSGQPSGPIPHLRFNCNRTYSEPSSRMQTSRKFRYRSA